VLAGGAAAPPRATHSQCGPGRTTQIHTQVSIRKLEEIHSATHPSARLGRNRIGGDGLDPEREALLERSQAEADEESEDED